MILITGVPSIHTASKAVKLNAYEYIPKPVSLYKLAESIANALNYRTLKDEKRRIEKDGLKYRQDLEELVALRTANLVQSNQRYQLLFENSKDAIYMAARDWTILAINHTALDLFEYSKSELIQLTCKELYADTVRYHVFQQVIEEKGFV